MTKITLNGKEYKMIDDFENEFTLSQYMELEGLIEPIQNHIIEAQNRLKKNIDNADGQIALGTEMLHILPKYIAIEKLIAYLVINVDEEEYNSETAIEREKEFRKIKMKELKEKGISQKAGEAVGFFIGSVNPVSQEFFQTMYKTNSVQSKTPSERKSKK